MTTPNPQPATFNILIHTLSDQDEDKGQLFNTIKNLSDKGTIKGIKPLSLTDGEDYWSLFFTCNYNKGVIEEILSHTNQRYFIHKLADRDIFETVD